MLYAHPHTAQVEESKNPLTREIRVENLPSPETAVGVAVVPAARGDAAVTRRKDDAGALHAELHELAALALLVVGRDVVLLLAVGDADDVGRLVHAALPLALVAQRVRVRVLGVDGRVTRLAECGVGAVGAVNGVEEGLCGRGKKGVLVGFLGYWRSKGGGVRG